MTAADQISVKPTGDGGVEFYDGADFLGGLVKIEPPKVSGQATPHGERKPGKGEVLPAHEVNRVRAMLRYCGDFDNHDARVRTGMALHHETGGSAQGFELWTAWAKQSDKFDADEHHKRWQSFFARSSGQRVTQASLAYIARGNGWREEMSEQFGELALPGAIKPPSFRAVELLPGVMGELAAAVARATQTPESASVMMVLGVLAAVLQRQFEVAPYGDDYRETLSLWVMAILASGARKTAIQAAVSAPIHRYEKLERDRMRVEIARNFSARLVAKKRIDALTQQAAKAADAGEREQLRQQIEDEELGMPPELRAPRLVTGDVTPERLQNLIAEHGERMTLMSDEPGIFRILNGQYSGGQANIDIFLQAQCGSPIRVDRAGREAHIDRPALSFVLMVQPGVLAEVTK